ncbi:MAG: nicotinate phosphoribosyltransferase [Mycoplasmataceae bacterium]|nr:nicotinate phosphoribosyltransferase [Mycoplasmataceae bacterium]
MKWSLPMLKYSAKYFEKTRKIIESNKPDSIVTLQFFQRQDNVLLCGINEVLELLKKETDVSKYTIKYLDEKSIINGMDIVLELTGQYKYFGEYEGIIDGMLARATSLATNARDVVKAANGKEVIFMGDRADHYLNQERDGYAVALGGVTTQVTDAHIEGHEGKAVGTIPHALIQMFEGDLNKALRAYKKEFPNEKLTALVDFNNDVILDTLRAFKEFKEELVAIRVDTSDGVSDKMFLNDEEYGVTPNMIFSLRKALDMVGGQAVKIIVSSGFNVAKIKKFEDVKAPVDVYGVGGSLLKINNSFTADAVMIDKKKIAKVGRSFKEHSLKEL